PEDPSIRNRRLFSERDFDLYEGTGNWETQAQVLEKRREEAISEVYRGKKIQDVLDFAASVETPFQVGVAFGAIAEGEADALLLPNLLDAQHKTIARFTAGFIVARFRKSGWTWVDSTVGK